MNKLKGFLTKAKYFAYGLVFFAVLTFAYMTYVRWTALVAAWQYPKQVSSLEFVEKLEVKSK